MTYPPFIHLVLKLKAWEQAESKRHPMSSPAIQPTSKEASHVLLFRSLSLSTRRAIPFAERKDYTVCRVFGTWRTNVALSLRERYGTLRYRRNSAK